MDSDRFEQIVGRDHVWLPAGETLDDVPVGLVVRPASPQEVAAVLAEARARAAAVVPVGGGSKLGWGNAPDAKAIVRLDLTRLAARTEIEPEEGVATVQAGVRVADLERVLAARGKRSGLTTPWPRATVGGTIAADAFGPELGCGRRLRDELLGLEVAHADGTLGRCGGRVVKNVTGFDLVRLHCGALGTLGVITEATFRLWPRPPQRSVLAGPDLAGWEAGLEAAQQLLASGADPAGVGLRREDSRSQDGRIRLLWILEGSERDVALRAERHRGEQCGEENWEQLAQELVREPAEGGVPLRLAGRPSDGRAIVREVVGCCGAGALLAVLPAAGLARLAIPVDALEPLLARARARGWMAFVESAPAEIKRRLDVFAPEAEALPLMRALKGRFDPGRVLSPGRYAGRI